jgi:hypothetical protein
MGFRLWPFGTFSFYRIKFSILFMDFFRIFINLQKTVLFALVADLLYLILKVFGL